MFLLSVAILALARVAFLSQWICKPSWLIYAIVTMDRSQKLKVLNKFRRSRRAVSASALADVLQEVAEHGLPELHSRSAMYEATSALLDEVTIHGKLLHPLSLTLTTGEKLDTWAVNHLRLCIMRTSRAAGSTHC